MIDVHWYFKFVFIVEIHLLALVIIKRKFCCVIIRRCFYFDGLIAWNAFIHKLSIIAQALWAENECAPSVFWQEQRSLSCFFFALSITLVLCAEKARNWVRAAQITKKKLMVRPRQLISINRKWREKLGGRLSLFYFFAAVCSCLYFVLWGRFLFLSLDDMLLYSTRALIARPPLLLPHNRPQKSNEKKLCGAEIPARRPT